MARRATPAQPAATPAAIAASAVSGNVPASLASSAAVFKPQRKANAQTDRYSIAKPWQLEAYRHVNICGEARYAATLFASIAGRAELGVSEPQALRNKATWIKEGPEVDALAELCPTVRERTKLIRDYMLHRTIAGECYLIARKRVDTDPGYIEPPDIDQLDLFDPAFDEAGLPDPNTPIWEIVAVTEIRKIGDTWEVKHDNNNYLPLSPEDPVIRLWNPDPENRREAWSPFRSMLPTLAEIEWLTKHIFTQVRSRLMSAGVWFLPDNLTFPPPPSDAVEGGAEAIAAMNEAEQFMLSLAASSMDMLDSTEVSFPSIVLADPIALAAVDQKKLIQFWSDIDDKAMTLRADAVRRFALGMDMPPDKVLGSSGMESHRGGSSGGSNHWGEWAKEEQTISAHIEPALDDFVGALTAGFLRLAVEDTTLVLAYDTAALRMRPDRSKEALEWYDRGVLKATVALKETGFDPDNDMMDDAEHKMWLLNRLVGGSATPEQIQAALGMLGVALPVVPLPSSEPAPALPGRSAPPSLEDHPYEGPPREQHDHSDAPFSARAASCEALVLRALEKAGNRLLNDGKRGRDKDRSTPAHLAHLTASAEHAVSSTEFDFSLAPTLLGDCTAAEQHGIVGALASYCAALVNDREPYTRETLLNTVKGL